MVTPPQPRPNRPRSAAAIRREQADLRRPPAEVCAVLAVEGRGEAVCLLRVRV
jgi:hypothetical protein